MEALLMNSATQMSIPNLILLIGGIICAVAFLVVIWLGILIFYVDRNRERMTPRKYPVGGFLSYMVASGKLKPWNTNPEKKESQENQSPENPEKKE